MTIVLLLALMIFLASICNALDTLHCMNSNRWEPYYRALSMKHKRFVIDFLSSATPFNLKTFCVITFLIMPRFLGWRLIPLAILSAIGPLPILFLALIEWLGLLPKFQDWADQAYNTLFNQIIGHHA